MQWSDHSFAVPTLFNDTASVFAPGTPSTNSFVIRLNVNPNNGTAIYSPSAVTNSALFNPSSTLTTRFLAYRPTGMKLTVYIMPEDVETVALAAPIVISGLPFQMNSSYSNYWDGTTSPNLNCDSIFQTKYGFQRRMSGMGGKSMIKYTTYWDFAKILGVTRSQYLADSQVICFPATNSTNPTIGVFLLMHISDTLPTGIARRGVTVQYKLKQYGRWEGQPIKVS